MQTEQQGVSSAFEFTGTWREFLPIALSNLALTIVTLGIYRFWAKARTRRYLWSRTRFIDDHLEWTGTGKEMFIGFLVVALIIAVPLALFQFVLIPLLIGGGGRQLIVLAGYGLFLMLMGFATFRALRYRLSRTYWHGIRGGAEDPGFHYALSALWKPFVGSLVFGMLMPWAMVSLWNERWNAMSFGPHRFESGANSESLTWRWAMIVIIPILFILGLAVILGAIGAETVDSYATSPTVALAMSVLPLFVLLGVGLAFAAYYAAYFRQVIDGMNLGPLGLHFSARTSDWIKLVLGDVLLVVLTLGLGVIFLSYRHWSFFIRHLGASGEVDLETMTQSMATAPREAEGLADAFDIGAF